MLGAQFYTFNQQFLSLIVPFVFIATCLSNCQIITWFTWQYKTGLKHSQQKQNPFNIKTTPKMAASHVLCSVSTLCGIQAFCIWWEGVENAAVSGAQQTNSQNAFVYCHTHLTLTQGQQTSFTSNRGNVVASLSIYLIICLPKTLINGKHSVYVSEALIVSVVKAKLRVFISSRKLHGFDTSFELGSCDRRNVKLCGLTSHTNPPTMKTILGDHCRCCLGVLTVQHRVQIMNRSVSFLVKV